MNGEYKCNEMSLYPKYFELKLRKVNDNSDFLNMKRDFTKPNEKIHYVDYLGKRVYDFESKYGKDRSLESLKLKVDKVGEFKLDYTNTADGRKFSHKLKLENGHLLNSVLVGERKVLSLDFNLAKNDKKISTNRIIFIKS